MGVCSRIRWFRMYCGFRLNMHLVPRCTSHDPDHTPARPLDPYFQGVVSVFPLILIMCPSFWLTIKYSIWRPSFLYITRQCLPSGTGPSRSRGPPVRAACSRLIGVSFVHGFDRYALKAGVSSSHNYIKIHEIPPSGEGWLGIRCTLYIPCHALTRAKLWNSSWLHQRYSGLRHCSALARLRTKHWHSCLITPRRISHVSARSRLDVSICGEDPH